MQCQVHKSTHSLCECADAAENRPTGQVVNIFVDFWMDVEVGGLNFHLHQVCFCFGSDGAFLGQAADCFLN